MTNPERIADNLADDLRLIRTSWPDMLIPIPRGSIGPRVTMVGKASPPPAPIGTLSLRRQAAEVLASWCRLVAEERDLRPELDTRDAEQMAGWLLIHVEWLAEHPAARDVAAELGKIAGSCDDVARQVRRRRFPIAPCIEHGTDEDGARVPCGGTLKAYLRSDDDMLPHVVACDVDPDHSWTASQWHALGRRLGRKFDEQAVHNLMTYLTGA